MHSKTFHVNFDIADFIRELQTPFPRYKPNFRAHMVDVIVEVSKEKAKYFKLKKHLPSQKVLSQQDNGNLLLAYRVTQPEELKELVKKWIPHMKVIEPFALKKEIEDELRVYLK